MPSPITGGNLVQRPVGGDITMSLEEAELVQRAIDAVVDFANTYPLEFQGYCPPERWADPIKIVGEAQARIQQQLNEGFTTVTLSHEQFFSIFDLDECVRGTRNIRTKNTETGLMILGIGNLGAAIVGIPAMGLVATAAGVGIMVATPLLAYLKDEENIEEPFRVGDCTPRRLGDHTGPNRVLERVIVGRPDRIENHHWGTIRPSNGNGPLIERAWCLRNGDALVRVEAWEGMVVELEPGWTMARTSLCEGRPEIAVWEPAEVPRRTAFGPIPQHSQHTEDWWIEYAGPLTNGQARKAGPFG